MACRCETAVKGIPKGRAQPSPLLAKEVMS